MVLVAYDYLQINGRAHNSVEEEIEELERPLLYSTCEVRLTLLRTSSSVKIDVELIPTRP